MDFDGALYSQRAEGDCALDLIGIYILFIGIRTLCWEIDSF